MERDDSRWDLRGVLGRATEEVVGTWWLAVTVRRAARSVRPPRPRPRPRRRHCSDGFCRGKLMHAPGEGQGRPRARGAQPHARRAHDHEVCPRGVGEERRVCAPLRQRSSADNNPMPSSDMMDDLSNSSPRETPSTLLLRIVANTHRRCAPRLLLKASNHPSSRPLARARLLMRTRVVRTAPPRAGGGGSRRATATSKSTTTAAGAVR